MHEQRKFPGWREAGGHHEWLRRLDAGSRHGNSAGMPETRPLLVARRSSHFSRVALLFAHELGVELEFRPVSSLLSQSSQDYGGNPALRVPTLLHAGERWFGALNISRRLWQLAGRPERLLWPEHLESPVLSNALELTLNGMSSEVVLLMERMARGGAEPASASARTSKAHASLMGCVSWLERELPSLLAALPVERRLSFLEVCLFCFADHLEWREVLELEPFPRLKAFRNEFAQRPSARATAYRFD